MLAAAALAVASTAASAQVLRAEIPFSFRTSDSVMPAGTYEVTGHNAGQWYQFHNLDTHTNTSLLTRAHRNAPKPWLKAGTPVLEFVCDEGRCTPNRIWTSRGDQAGEFFKQPAEDGKPARLALIRLVPATGR
jgi:hypothetical protein